MSKPEKTRTPAVQIRNQQPINPHERLTFRVDEAERVTGLRRTKLYQLIKAGKLKSTRVEGQRLINGDSLRSYISGEAA